MSDFDLDPDADTDAALPDDAPRISAEVTVDGDVLPPTVQVNGDVPEPVVEAVQAAVEAYPNACDEPRLYSAGAIDRDAHHAQAVLVASWNETPVVGDDGGMEGWLPAWRAREKFDATLADALPEAIHSEPFDGRASGFYDD